MAHSGRIDWSTIAYSDDILQGTPCGKNVYIYYDNSQLPNCWRVKQIQGTRIEQVCDLIFRTLFCEEESIALIRTFTEDDWSMLESISVYSTGPNPTQQGDVLTWILESCQQHGYFPDGLQRTILRRQVDCRKRNLSSSDSSLENPQEDVSIPERRIVRSRRDDPRKRKFSP